MEVTLKQIEEDDRFKLPFNITHSTDGRLTIDKITFASTKNGTSITFWADRASLFPELCEFPKEPKYIPFTQEDWEQFAYELIKHDEYSAMFKIQSFDKTSILYIGHTGNPVTMSFTQLMLQCKFVKTNKPCGKLLT